ncbi:hypothetical protein BASA50_004789 [Batrachochytrium salamandrivorans]|uniref:Pre-mRNA-splicing factor ISY1 n=1 Tax=Batrachochytrium salamandrivorans TaxID=1357716 RepID=A0ABQ8FEQ7_9FUNG|nr:hypothetical protein BASA60_007901 [Batrachochytrium salamandrivorans]KAH6571673.1 hypothetical protein BASA62_003759 [Batrachochytrium salamandrivorans]KAH6590676.1 hypothetical protein BASA61_005196 [Batrachochytrium salamandrivorans]KAH6597031.1 hypothetical protein BASA50_004789 [Batrachochytrium salamandrivorans]KAH9273422.1 hypothetical protein BASA83_004086 [Batrachochytrium salamandrivorans]
MLYRFREAQRIEAGGSSSSDKRPYLASTVQTLKEAEKWRREVMREASRRIERIKDASMTDFQVRDVNDEINKLMREKRHWEVRIRDLGGTDHIHRGGSVLDIEGKSVPGTKGYRYYGRAKDLPGIKELFQQAAMEDTKVAPEDLWHRVDSDYYGYRDEDDGLLLAYEKDEESQTKDAIVDRFGAEGQECLDENQLQAPPVPSQKEIGAWFLQRRKQEVADRYLNSATV